MVVLCSSFSAQTTLVTVSLSNATLSEFLGTIEKQTGYTFMYDDSVNENFRFSINEHQKSLDQILKLAFQSKNIEYVITGNQIILKKKRH